MTEDLLLVLKQARDVNLDLFSEYTCLAADCKRNDDDLSYRYWLDRACEVSRVIRVISDDLLLRKGGDKL